MSDDPGKYGRHLREVVERHLAGPISEHRLVCKCKRCRKAQKRGERPRLT